MIAAGIDVGTETTKVVILNNKEIASWHLLAEGDENAARLGEKALSKAAHKAGIKPADIQNLAVTGLVGIQFPFLNEQLPEAMCIAKGIEWLLPSTRTALDLGAGKSLVVKCHHGRPIKIARNDKCAFGTGKYLDIVGKILGMGSEEMATLFLKSKEDVDIQSTCAVFVESEVISLLHMKSRPEDIARGALRGLAKRIYPLLLEVGMEREVTLVGGLARNRGVVAAFEELLGHNLLVPPEPQIVAALGAALITQERAAA
jgi:predicted CoA-substrate-specific enzyme activase